METETKVVEVAWELGEFERGESVYGLATACTNCGTRGPTIFIRCGTEAAHNKVVCRICGCRTLKALAELVGEYTV